MHREPNAATFFNGFAETFDTIYDQKRNVFMRWVDCTFRSDMFIRYALTFEALGQLKESTVLDIGCGSGPYIIEAFKRGACRVTGVDPAQYRPGARTVSTEWVFRTDVNYLRFPGSSPAARLSSDGRHGCVADPKPSDRLPVGKQLAVPRSPNTGSEPFARFDCGDVLYFIMKHAFVPARLPVYGYSYPENPGAG
jgi:SAM-dependent methyltransferase